ncbi:LOW QUALITY PROTEIN: integrator complex subunit 6 [Lampetra fluviatilis]
MPILLFLLDTSASMNQRTYLGTTYLDVAKGAVEIFMKLRARDPASRGDRYMLVTLDEPPYGIKAGWKENHATFMSELKNLQATGLTTLGQALKSAFDLLNLNRLVSGIDNYGQGRNPFFLEPAIVITITDGSKLSNGSSVQDELQLPLSSPLPGSELTKEPFRWDERLFALVLRQPGSTASEPEQLGSVPLDDSPITPMCDVTGGRSYCVRTQRMLNQCLESLVQKVQSGVVIHFEKVGPDPPPVSEDGGADLSRTTASCSPLPWHSCHRLIYVRPNPKTGVPIGHWPVPEAFWPDQNIPALPPRTAHPVVKFSCTDGEPMVIDKLPFDKYELEPSPLTQFILERKSPHTCWQVFVSNSGKYSELGHPFGYLKASTSLTCVNLFVMPYNFPMLLPLLDDLFKVHKLKPPVKWRQSFDSYLKTMPPYYLGPLKKALRMMGAPNLIAENVEFTLSYSVITYLKKLSQQAKLESERVISSVGKRAPQEAGLKVRTRTAASSGGTTAASSSQRRELRQLLAGLAGDAPARHNADIKDFPGFQIAVLNKEVKPQPFRNAYDISRRGLLDQLTRMRANLLRATTTPHGALRSTDEDQMHSVPVAQMGNYQEFLKQQPSPLREIDPDQPKRLHTFGNPFKLDKKGMMIDEADEFVTGPQNRSKRPGGGGSGDGGGAQSPSKRRRNASPLPPPRPRPLAPPASLANHVVGGVAAGGGRGAACTPTPPPPTILATPAQPSQPNLIKPVAIRGTELNNQIVDISSDDLPNANSQPAVPLLPAPAISSPAAATETENHVGASLATDEEDEEDEEGGGGDEGLASSENHAANSLRETRGRVATATDGLGGKTEIKAAKVRETNNEIWGKVVREIRKPGRNYEHIFSLLELVRGSTDLQVMFIQNVIREASRFKKRVLIQQLEEAMQRVRTGKTDIPKPTCPLPNHVNSR